MSHGRSCTHRGDPGGRPPGVAAAGAEQGAPARVVERARIVLLAGEGVPGKQIAARVGCAEPTVVTWRRRDAEHGLVGLEALPRPGTESPMPEALRDHTSL